MWNPLKMPMTYSHLSRDCTAVLRQEDDCIVNSMNESVGDYDYIGISMTEPITGDCRITAQCSFEKFGAPLIVLADEIRTEGNVRRYGAMYEIVAYEGGCNVWRILPEPDPAVPGQDFTVRSILKASFPVEAGSLVTLSVRLCGRRAHVSLNGYAFAVDLPDLPASYFVGITACEGIDRFYALTVDPA